MPLLNHTQTPDSKECVHEKSRKEMRAERKAQKRKEGDNSKQESETVAKPLTREEKKGGKLLINALMELPSDVVFIYILNASD